MNGCLQHRLAAPVRGERMRWRAARWATAALCLAALHGPGWSQTPGEENPFYKPSIGQSGKDVVWVPTSQALVDRMLDMVQLTPADRLVDLGSGDGRMVITAAKRGAQARGIEFNPELVELSRRRARAEGVGNRAVFEEGDIFKSDFSDATVVTLFLLPSLNVRLRPILLDMKPGTRIVSNTFTMEDWEPDETVQVVQGCAGHCEAHKWVVPAKVAGKWAIGDKELVLTQTYQKLEGTLSDGNGPMPISEGRVHGTRITFVAGNQRYAGDIGEQAMRGTVDGKGRWEARLVEQ